MLKVLVADDHPIVREGLKRLIEDEFDSAVVHESSYARDAMEAIRTQSWDIAILDINFPDQNGLEVLKRIKEKFPQLPVIILSSEEGLEVSANIIKFGAFDYIVKDDNAFGRLEIVLKNAMEQTQLKKDVGSQRQVAFILMIIIVVLFIAGLIERFFF